MYDLESADRYTDLAELLMDQQVFITEKLEGENTWATATHDAETLMGMRDNTILEKPDVENRFHRVLRLCGVDEFAQSLSSKYKQRATVYGEFIGPGCGVGNYYDLDASTVKIFDIRMQFAWMSPEEMLYAVTAFYGKDTDMVVPILSHLDTLRGWLNGRTVKQASDGMSVLCSMKRREGIVIKPMTEGQRDDRIGRLVLKQRSPAYLANTDF
jgi:phage shock protein PspC (stress-responsive transcriptional regulator)